ncbi:MAG TPA: cupin domain-containing protein [Candidatus Dormibacteraeota bacterium]|nr:cupin domain-containing protein [Candidatus Dormibacteraeota bacterium]
MTKGFVGDIKKAAKENDFFRRVLFTGKSSQLVLMSLEPGEDIGAEVHSVDQIIYVVDGEGMVELDGDKKEFEKGDVVFVPAGVRHNVVNSEDKEAMKLFTVYAPPQHADGTIHPTKADAEAAEAKPLAATFGA